MSTPDRSKGHSEVSDPSKANDFAKEPSSTNTLFVVGSEGKGIKKSIADLCTDTMFIPGGDSLVDSLNLSVAVGVVLSNSSSMRQPRSANWDK